MFAYKKIECNLDVVFKTGKALMTIPLPNGRD